MLEEKIKALLDELPEERRIIIIKKYSTPMEEEVMSPKVKKLLDIFSQLSEDEKKMFHKNICKSMDMECEKEVETEKEVEVKKEWALDY